MTPSALLPFVLILAACEREPAATSSREPQGRAVRGTASRAGQQQDLSSPDGSLRARVPIVSMQGRDFATWWCPELSSAGGELLFRDRECFPGRFNVYWGWDAQQRFWVYNSDDGALWIYAPEGEGWGRRAWLPGDGLTPPPSLAERLAG
jgi:hypothetical protein